MDAESAFATRVASLRREELSLETLEKAYYPHALAVVAAAERALKGTRP